MTTHQTVSKPVILRAAQRPLRIFTLLHPDNLCRAASKNHVYYEKEVVLEYSSLKEKLIAHRRRLHRIPELDRDLPKTTAYIKEHLAGLPCEVTDISDAGFCALFKGGRAPDDAPATAFRTDMDALPVTEETGLDFVSEHAGAMHACGHDGHMSILLGLAGEVAEKLPELDRNVLLVFQAAEETTGGARDIAGSGILEETRTEKIYGMHLWPGYPPGSVVCRDGDFMASTMVLYYDIEGKSAHIGQYKKGIDALDAACKFIEKCYEMERSEISPEVRRLLRFGLMRSGTANNIVADSAYLEGALRVYGDEVREFILGRMDEIAGEISARTKARFTFRHSNPYPAVVNPHGLFEETRRTLIKAGVEFIEPDEPLMIAEDFSWYQKRLPGLFMHLGTGGSVPLHNPRYDIDEDVLVHGVGIYKTLLGI
jgi:hippurate hydrolase